jgi:hypothetical protein
LDGRVDVACVAKVLHTNEVFLGDWCGQGLTIGSALLEGTDDSEGIDLRTGTIAIPAQWVGLLVMSNMSNSCNTSVGTVFLGNFEGIIDLDRLARAHW